MRIKILIALFALGTLTYAATAPTPNMSNEFTAGWHQENADIACEDCHVDDNYGSVSRNNCIQCHDEADLIESTQYLKETLNRNPHDGHYIDLECTQCHSGHAENSYLCGECH